MRKGSIFNGADTRLILGRHLSQATQSLMGMVAASGSSAKRYSPSLRDRPDGPRLRAFPPHAIKPVPVAEAPVLCPHSQ